MNEQKQYRDNLLEWCNTVELTWESMKPRCSQLFGRESLKEWEESCRQLKVKLQEDTIADYDDYGTAKSLYEQLEQLYRESTVYQEEIEVDSELRSEMEDEKQMDEENFETDSFPEEVEVESDPYIDPAEQKQYRADLLEWCTNLYSNWTRMKPRYLSLVDKESLEGWEGLFSQLKEKLEADPTADYDDYETANTLYEQWEKLLEESYVLQKEIKG
jgi:hypothetical protein